MSILDDTHKTSPAYYEPRAIKADTRQHKLRVLIDEVATCRGLTIQMSLRLMSLAATSDPATRDQLCFEFRDMAAQFGHNIDLLYGSDPVESQDPAQIRWIRKVVAPNAKRASQIKAIKNRIQATADGLCQTGPNFDEARAFYQENWPEVRDAMTSIIWDLWADLDAQRTEAIAETDRMKTTLHRTLRDIKKFSMAVRMIALNTSVLASRPAEAGDGFKAIASGVRELAEDIQSSTDRAEAVVMDMTHLQ
jgi:methyl-accepting chemotaxis protein